jgi:predicted lipoprotein with Yx(FWY)xxD motif
MTRSKPITVLALAAAVPLFGSSMSAATASQAPRTTTSARVATVRVAHSRLGKILVDSRGHSLYLFKKDSRTKSACFGACATFWPPLRASKPTVGSGLSASKVGTIRRSDGTRQVTYNHHPLYRYVADTRAGEVNGQGVTAFGASWFVLSPAGNQISRQP